MKKTIYNILLCVLMAGVIPPVNVSAEDDVNSYLYEEKPVTNNGSIVGNVNKDSAQATPKDALYLVRYLAGWE